MDERTVNLNEPPEERAIWFNTKNANGENKWIMKLEHGGKIRFNREEFPDLTEDDFATKVLTILERAVLFFGKKDWLMGEDATK